MFNDGEKRSDGPVPGGAMAGLVEMTGEGAGQGGGRCGRAGGSLPRRVGGAGRGARARLHRVPPGRGQAGGGGPVVSRRRALLLSGELLSALVLVLLLIDPGRDLGPVFLLLGLAAVLLLARRWL